MSHPGSAALRPLALFPATLVTALGIAAMFAAAYRSAAWGLGLRAQIAVGTVLLALPAILVALAHPPARRAALGEESPGLRSLLLSGLLGAALWLASIGIMELQSLLLPPPEGYIDGFRALHAALAPKGPLDALVSLVVIALLPGVCEELVVRGVLLPALAARLAPAAAVAVSATLFAAIHYDVFRFLFTFSIGLAFGFLRLGTGSLWPSVTAHAALNALTFAIAPYVDDPSRPYAPEPLLGLACLVAGCSLAIPLWRQLTPKGGAGRRQPPA